MLKYFYIQTSYVFPDQILHSYWNTRAVDKIVLVLRGQLRQKGGRGVWFPGDPVQSNSYYYILFTYLT
jgi:hypothetical protein